MICLYLLLGIIAVVMERDQGIPAVYLPPEYLPVPNQARVAPG